jgi:hypothetical protein
MSYSTGLRLATKGQVVAVIPPANYSGAASTDIYISQKNTSHVTYILKTGAWAGGTAAVTLLQATDVAGTGSKALAFDTVYTNAANTASDLLVKTAVASNTFNLTAANAIYLIEVDTSSLDVTNSFDCLALHVATPGSNADYYDAVAVLFPLRYSGNTPPSALTN